MSPRPSRLSVVVPVYQVEDYLAACLASVLGQRLPRRTELEVVCVDDGSTDGSAAILDRVAASSQVRVLRQENAGLGAARNAGVAAATGDLLAFCDSDDELPDHAYRPMVRSLRRTGSAIAVGTLVRDRGGRRETGPLMRANHERRRTGVTVADQPLLLADVFAVNKVYRREFWDDAGLAFPVDTRYEDQPTLTRALLAAPAVDVLTDVVYTWRIRDDGSSITQGRARVEDLRDRVATKRDSTEQVVAAREPALLGPWFRQVLPVDMWEYFRAAPTAGDDYWALLRDAVEEFWNPSTVPFAETAVPVQQRLMGHLVAADRREDLAALIAFLDDRGVPVIDGVFQHPWLEEPGLPAGVSRA